METFLSRQEREELDSVFEELKKSKSYRPDVYGILHDLYSAVQEADLKRIEHLAKDLSVLCEAILKEQEEAA